MKPKSDMQAEDNPNLETKASEKESAPVKTISTKPGFFTVALRWIIVAVVFFLIGAGVVYFTLYQTASKDLQAAKVDSTKVSESLSAAEVDLEKAKADLSTTQASLNETTTALQTSQQAALLYKLEADVNAARAALYKLDPSTARQAISYATADLTELAKTSIDAESLSGLQPRLETALANLETDPQKAMDALDTLFTNLLLLGSNLIK